MNIKAYQDRLNCRYAAVNDVFEECLHYACRVLSEKGVEKYLDGAALICQTGRGAEAVLSYLQIAPAVAVLAGEETLELSARSCWKIARTPDAMAIVAFVQCLPAVARRYPSESCFQTFIDLSLYLMEQTQSSIHGSTPTIASPSLVDYLDKVPDLVKLLSLSGLKNWIEYGVANHKEHPDNQRSYFQMESADSRAILQRERNGTLFADNERKLSLYLHSLWQTDDYLVPYSTISKDIAFLQPYYDSDGIRIPDVYEDTEQVSGINQYRLTLAHIAAHKRWSKPMFADNFSPFQRMAIEVFEDCRIDYLMGKKYPGIKKYQLALHPKPVEGSCNEELESCLRHRLSMLSYAILDENHGYKHSIINDFVARFHAAMNEGNSSMDEMANMAIVFIARTRKGTDLQSKMRFNDTVIPYRDDNRHLWRFIEEGDEEESFDVRSDRKEEKELDSLPPRLYHEWDYQSLSYKPDWVSVYEGLHSSGSEAFIDKILLQHQSLAKKLKRMLDLLKPQQFVRVRYQEDGSELDLDVALRSWIDLQSGSQPDTRINMSHKTDGRDIAVTLLVDLSESLNENVSGGTQTLLELNQEAVALLAWSIEQLGDPLAIAGFNSNTRHGVHYKHIKGFTEHWDDTVKARLADMQASYSTRMGAAIRHAGYYLEKQTADKKLLLILTDGEPADIDEKDGDLLIKDAHKAVQEMDDKGIFSYCINLDPKADQYVSDIFGHQYTIIDHVEKLPEKLPELFMSLTR